MQKLTAETKSTRKTGSVDTDAARADVASRGGAAKSLSGAWGRVQSQMAARYPRMCRSALDDLSSPEPKDDDWMTSEVQRQEATAAVVMAEACSERKEVTLMKTRLLRKGGICVRYKCCALQMLTNVSSMAILADHSFFDAYAGESKDGFPAAKFSTGGIISIGTAALASDNLDELSTQT
ncbi:hypothetical protein CK203_036583 [Vitis vinifera]|uniref:DUF7392 domain-containing protein n=1 Tax=Vitis vinifera TaxID=29760 RepID=A0A438HZR0_VITVI|nr:hypothetical protein CK203_036583 [Vitis vinifera]